MRRRRKNGRRLALAMLILLLAAGLGLLTIRFQRIFMEYAVNVCEDSAIQEINTLMEDEVFSHPDEFADLVVLERDSDNRITALRTDIIAVGKVKARIVNGLFDRLDYLDVMIIDFNKMVEELGSIETLKTDFFSNVSHEIKTPLAIIQNNAELLCMEKKPEKQKEYAEVIFQTTKRLSELISNILKLNKLEKQAITPVAEEYDLCGQLAECAVNYEPVWEKKDIGFDADMEDSVKIAADAALMELVWNNLFSNAVKFTEPGGTIKLTEQSDDSEIRVSVEDTGCGMTEETRKHIFEKFYQGDTSHAMAGNGLGLALSLRVLQLNDYKIEVESEPGRGSKFTVIIPKR